MEKQAKDLYRTVYECFSTLQIAIEKAHESSQGKINLLELVDFLYATKKASEMLDESAKKLRGLVDAQKRIICLRWVNSNLSQDNIKTEHVTATPRVTDMPVLPTYKNAPDDYVAFCKHFAITSDIIENDSLRPHWPGMKKQIQDDAEQGKPLPPGCDPSKTYPAYDVLLRKKKGVLEA